MAHVAISLIVYILITHSESQKIRGIKGVLTDKYLRFCLHNKLLNPPLEASPGLNLLLGYQGACLLMKLGPELGLEVSKDLNDSLDGQFGGGEWGAKRDTCNEKMFFFFHKGSAVNLRKGFSHWPFLLVIFSLKRIACQKVSTFTEREREKLLGMAYWGHGDGKGRERNIKI